MYQLLREESSYRITWHKDHELYSELLKTVQSLQEAVEVIDSTAVEAELTSHISALHMACDNTRQVLEAAEFDARYAIDMKQIPRPTNGPKALLLAIKFANYLIGDVRNNYEFFVSAITRAPGPSEFASGKKWPYLQVKGSRPILCLRPFGVQGIPLCMLHEVFRLFENNVKDSPPSDYVEQSGTAGILCAYMPDPFHDDAARGDMFTAATEFLFDPDFKWQEDVRLQEPGAECAGVELKACILSGGRPLCFREDRSEAGAGNGDPYLHAARLYQVVLEMAIARDGPSVECPVFILLVIGPLLWVCGGVYDGQNPVVEPLGAPYVMFEDSQRGGRHEQLARLLYALSIAVVSLSFGEQSSDMSPVEYLGKVNVPRVFSSFQNTKGTQQPISFLRRMGRSTNLIFEATSPDYAPGLVVKFCESYGLEVQHALAQRGLAPAYYGHVHLEGTPKGYVMEYLPPPLEGSLGPGWVPLSNIKQECVCDSIKLCISRRLQEVLCTLRANSFLHADLCSAKVLVHVDTAGVPDVSSGTAKIRVIDFEWAGKSGEVVYPLNPLDPMSGRLITDPAHDRTTLESSWVTRKRVKVARGLRRCSSRKSKRRSI